MGKKMEGRRAMTSTTQNDGITTGQLRTVVWVLAILAVLAPVAVAWGMLIYSDKVQCEQIERKLDKEYFMLYKENIDTKLEKIDYKLEEIYDAIVEKNK